MPGVSPATDEEIQAVCNDPNNVSYVCMGFRPGIRAWMTEIEVTRFRPGTLRNDEFHMVLMKWPDGVPLLWLIIIFDKSEQEFAESILWKNGLRKVEEGFTQMVMGGKKGLEKFPITGDNVFFLENHSKGAANVFYSNNPEKMNAAKELEDRQCQVFFDQHTEWLKTPEAEKEIAEYMKRHPEGYNL